MSRVLRFVSNFGKKPPSSSFSVPSFSMSSAITLFLCGDVMTGRGIDQILPVSCDPAIHEPAMNSAKGYVQIAEMATGRIPKPVGVDYIWGDALPELDKRKPDARIINLETTATTSSSWEPKGINYRMHPENSLCLKAAKIDCCVLANNHMLDWGYAGLAETLETLRNFGIQTAGAGLNQAQAKTPAVIEISGKGRLLVFSYGFPSSGVPKRWAATDDRPGVNFLPDLSSKSVSKVAELVSKSKRPENDVVVASLHWGGNWGYEIEDEEVRFAHALIDCAGVDVVHGHSSHHVKGIEVYRNKLILYGCGDFLNDYEGITGHEEYRDDLTLMYFPSIDVGTGNLLFLLMTPMHIRHFKLNTPNRADALWLYRVLCREGRNLPKPLKMEDDDTITLALA